MAANATFALKAGVWFRRARLVMLSPDPRQSAPPSGRKSTYPAVQFPQASSIKSTNFNEERTFLFEYTNDDTINKSNDLIIANLVHAFLLFEAHGYVISSG